MVLLLANVTFKHSMSHELRVYKHHASPVHVWVALVATIFWARNVALNLIPLLPKALKRASNPKMTQKS
jgi:hypothetical protein